LVVKGILVRNPFREISYLAQRIEVPFQGQMVPADRLEFEAEKEPWCVYRLEDGTTLRMKTVLGSVSRLVDQYMPDGDPVYLLGVGGVPMLEVPPALKKKNP
jgi:hypothetical protein